MKVTLKGLSAAHESIWNLQYGWVVMAALFLAASLVFPKHYAPWTPEQKASIDQFIAIVLVTIAGAMIAWLLGMVFVGLGLTFSKRARQHYDTQQAKQTA